MSKPLIGVTCDYDVQKQTSQIFDGYYRAILRSGGLPYLIPRIDEGTIPEIIDLLGGIVFTGGGDVEPAYFGEAPNPRLGSINPYRDRLEIPLCREVMDRDIPVLGICRGMQLMNIAMGGEIYQDLDSQWDKGFCRSTANSPRLVWEPCSRAGKGSRLAELLRNERIRTNSFHHQAVREPADCFR